MKKLFLAVALAGLGVSSASADITLHITGATAFRASAVKGIEWLLGGTAADVGSPNGGPFQCAYLSSAAGTSAHRGASHVILRGNPTAGPWASLGIVTVKCSWGGSTGGLTVASNTTKTITQQSGVNGWMNPSNLPGSAYVNVGSPSYTLESGETLRPDAVFSDSFQETFGISGLLGLPTGASDTGKVGVIPFNWVACNGLANAQNFTGNTTTTPPNNNQITNVVYNNNTGAGFPDVGIQVGDIIGGPGLPYNALVTAVTGSGPFTITFSGVATATAATAQFVGGDNVAFPGSNLTDMQAAVVLGSGATLLSQISGNIADNGTFVYAYGRNADSGTRVSCLAENILGVNALPIHHQPTFDNGAFLAGTQVRRIVDIGQWPPDSTLIPLLGVDYGVGNSGYPGGGDLADALKTPGAVTAAADGTYPPLGGTGGWMIAYISRSDAARATASTGGANTAKRLAFNGVADFAGATSTAGAVTNVDSVIQEGLYKAWEFEHFYASVDASAAAKSALVPLADRIVGFEASAGGLTLDSMHVSRPFEGGLIAP